MKDAKAREPLRRLEEALDAQRVEIELLRQELDRLKTESEGLRVSAVRYIASWTPTRRKLERIGAMARSTEARMADYLADAA